MSRNLLFNLLTAAALVIVAGLTAREALATSNAVSRANPANEIRDSACATLPSQLSVHTEFVSEKGLWVTYTGQGPSGLDGGPMSLLTAHPTCSR